MTSLLVSKDDLLETRVSSQVLKIFKFGVLLMVLVQIIGFYIDSDLIFSEGGLFPLSVTNVYFQNPLIIGIGLYIHPFLLGMTFFTILAFHKRLQTFCFLVLFFCEWLLTRRAFLFCNAGDTALLFFTLMAALTPTVSFTSRNKIRTLQVFHLYILAAIIYCMNFFLKISSAWGSGRGLHDSLAHKEIVWPYLLGWADSRGVVFFNYAAMATIFLLAIGPLVSPRRPRLRNSLISLGIAYHVLANVLFRLSWLSIPFILLQVALLVPDQPDIAATPTLKKKLPGKVLIALIFLMCAFFGVRSGSELLILKDNVFPVGHNWYMFAPPPSGSLEWSAHIRIPGEEIVWSQPTLSQKTSFFIYQHQYKFFYNMRRAEMVPVVLNYNKYLCQWALDDHLQVIDLQLSLKTFYFNTETERTVTYPMDPCLR